MVSHRPDRVYPVIYSRTLLHHLSGGSGRGGSNSNKAPWELQSSWKLHSQLSLGTKPPAWLLLRHLQALQESLASYCISKPLLNGILAESLQHDNVQLLKEKLSHFFRGCSLSWCFPGASHRSLICDSYLRCTNQVQSQHHEAFVCVRLY